MSEVKQARGQANIVIGTWNRRKFVVEKQFQTNKFSLFITKGVYIFKRFNRNRELIPQCWRSHRESAFASFRNKMLFGNG